MKAKEKAEELVDKYIPLVYCYMGSGMLSNDYDENVAKDNAKKCALIAVDEIMKIPILGRSHNRDESQYDYWQQVKNEIINL